MNGSLSGHGYSEEDLLPVSALADLVFCERRTALHFVEGAWEDNPFTVEGTHLHQRVDALESAEVRGNLRIARGLRLRSLQLGLVGKADVVEFHRVDHVSVSEEIVPGGGMADSVRLPGVSGRWRPFPVEYKRGRLRREEGYEVQLCAQAFCLEEMLSVKVPSGAIFYGQPRRRLEVIFDGQLRKQTETAAARLHQIVGAGKTPPARYEKKCERCSLLNLCLPGVTGSRRSARSYLRRGLADAEGGEG